MKTIVKIIGLAALVTASTASFAQSTGTKSTTGGTMPAEETTNAPSKDRSVSKHDTSQGNTLPTNPGSSGSKALKKNAKTKK